MTIDFEAMAAEARQQHEAKVAAAEVKALSDKEARTRTIDTGIEALRLHVLPILEQAKAAFEKDGATFEIKEALDVHQYAGILPSVSAIMFKTVPSRVVSGRTQQARSDKMKLESDGVDIFMYAGNEHTMSHRDRAGQVKVGHAEQLLKRGISDLIASFYKAIGA